MIQNVAVLDFGSSKVSVLIGRQGVNDTLILESVGEAKYDGFVEGEFLNPNNVAVAIGEAITQAEKNAESRIDKIYVGVPGDFTVCVSKDVKISFDKKRKISEADVRALHERGNTFAEDKQLLLLHVQPVYYTLDDDRRVIDPVKMTTSKLSGYLSYLLAERYFIDVVESILGELKIEQIEFVSGSLAEVLFLFPDSKRDRYVVMVDVDYITTTVALARGDGILSLHTFSIGGGTVDGDLATYFQIPFSEAVELRRKVVLNLNMRESDVYEVNGIGYPAQLVNEIVSARLNIIARAIRKCVELSDYELPEDIPFSLTGGGISNMRGAKEILSYMLKRQVEIVSPTIPQLEKPELSSRLALLSLAVNIEPKQKIGLFAKIFAKN